MPLPEGMVYDGGLYKQMPALVRDIKLNVSVVRTGPNPNPNPALTLTLTLALTLVRPAPPGLTRHKLILRVAWDRNVCVSCDDRFVSPNQRATVGASASGW